MDFEDILTQVGDFGVYQKCMVLLIIMPISIINMLYDSTFMLLTPEHWCYVPQLKNLSKELQSELIRPLTKAQGLPSNDSCHMYDIDYYEAAKSLALPANRSQLMTSRCDNGWVYDTTVFSETAATKFNLVCDHAYYVSLLLSIGALGVVVATPALSSLSDRIGRRYSFLVVITVFLVSCVSPIILRDFISFSISRFVAGSVFNVHYQIPFVLVMETVGPKHRTKVASLSAIGYAIGGCLFPIIAYLTGNWVLFSVTQLTLTLPFFVFWRFLPESASWLIARGRYDDAFATLSRAAQVNGKQVPVNLMQQIKTVGAKQLENKSTQKDSLWNLLKVKELRRNFLIVTLIYITNVLAYGGLALNTLNFHGSEFINYFLLSVVDIPALLVGWYLIEGPLGRRWSNTLALLLCGLSLCSSVLINPSQRTLFTVMSLTGKFGIAGSYMIIYQQAAELYPTTLRSQGIGISTTFSAAMGIAVPYITYLGRYGLWIPMTIMGGGCLLASVAASFLPETLNENLPQNASDSISFSKNHKYFSLAKTKDK